MLSASGIFDGDGNPYYILLWRWCQSPQLEWKKRTKHIDTARPHDWIWIFLHSTSDGLFILRPTLKSYFPVFSLGYIVPVDCWFWGSLLGTRPTVHEWKDILLGSKTLAIPNQQTNSNDSLPGESSYGTPSKTWRFRIFRMDDDFPFQGHFFLL